MATDWRIPAVSASRATGDCRWNARRSAVPSRDCAGTTPIDGDEVIGAVVRTRTNVKPVYVSVGHLVNLEDAVRLVLACAPRYRLPEPLRLAHAMARQGRMPDIRTKGRA
jgi:deoxyinosine 3'endonuclease (endonuclease V)